MKAVLEKNLVAGRAYANGDDESNVMFSILKFIGRDKYNDPLFVFVTGMNCFVENEDGTIEMMADNSCIWYELTQEKI